MDIPLAKAFADDHYYVGEKIIVHSQPFWSAWAQGWDGMICEITKIQDDAIEVVHPNENNALRIIRDTNGIETMEKTDEVQRVPLSEEENVLLAQEAKDGQALTLGFNAHGMWINVCPESQWAVDRLAEIRKERHRASFGT